MIQISGDFFRQGRRECRVRFRKNVGALFLFAYAPVSIRMWLRGLSCLVLCLLSVGLLVVSVRVAGARHPQPRGCGPFFFSLACLLLVDCLRPCRARVGVGSTGGNLDSLTVKEDCE